MEKTLYDKYGGFSVVSKIVLDLYDRLLDDDDVGPFFDNVEMGRIVDHQTKFVSSLMGGPASYNDDQIRTLHDHGLSDEDVATVVGAFESRRALVVG